MNYHGLPFWAIHWPSLKPEYQRKWKGRNCMFFPSSAIFFSLKKNYLFKLFIYFMSKIIKHPDKSCVVITNDWTVCLCLFISGQSDTETCTRNSPSRGRQYNQNNMSRNFFFSLLLPLTPRTSNFKTKSNFLTFFFNHLRVSLYLPTFCWFNHCCSGLTNYHYKKPVFVT